MFFSYNTYLKKPKLKNYYQLFLLTQILWNRVFLIKILVTYILFYFSLLSHVEVILIIVYDYHITYYILIYNIIFKF